jgi:phosphinothricin acetyltransferase
MNPVIRPVTESDADAICEIYNHFVLNTAITFERAPVSSTDMVLRIREITASYPWLVADTGEDVIGYAYAARWRSRAAYDQTAETTIYVRHDCARTGVGFPLYMALLDALGKIGMHAALGCIALPNPASVALHERCAFRKVAHFPQVGRKFDQWVDVGFWQALLPLEAADHAGGLPVKP